MQRAVVRVVDVPGGDPGVTVADVLAGADLTLIYGAKATGSFVGKGARVNLLLNEEGDKVDKIGSDCVAAHSDPEVDEHVENVDSSCPL